MFNFNLAGIASKSPLWSWVGVVEMSLCVVDLVVVFCGGAAVRRGHVSVYGCWDAATVLLVVVSQRQAEQAGAGGQVDVLHVLHLRSTHRTQL